jgi:hypothetical protein
MGYALESARHEPAGKRLLTAGRRRNGRNSAPKDGPPVRSRQREAAEEGAPADDALDALLTTLTGALAGKALGLLPAGRTPGVLGLARAAAAGAGAALLREVLDPLLRGEARIPQLGPETGEALFAGAARGLLYGAVVEPRLHGPAALRGALYGSIEYAVSPWGGLGQLMGERAPHRRLPLVQGLLGDYALGDDGWLDHLVFGLALALLYGGPGSEESSGTTEEV